MAFVFSSWYIVAAFLVVGIAVCLFLFFRMDKQDKGIINKFLSESQIQEEETPNNDSSNGEETPKVKKCEYCEATNTAEATKCSSCGANLKIE